MVIFEGDHLDDFVIIILIPFRYHNDEFTDIKLMLLERIKMIPQRDPGDHGGVSPQAPVQDPLKLIKMIRFLLSVQVTPIPPSYITSGHVFYAI